MYFCPKCGFTLPVEPVLPFNCHCGYRDLGNGKGEQTAAQPVVAPPDGVGTILARKTRILKWAGKLIFFWHGCQCDKRAAEMNTRGLQWCKDNRETIIGWLMESPVAKLVPDARERAARLLDESIEEAESAG